MSVLKCTQSSVRVRCVCETLLVHLTWDACVCVTVKIKPTTQISLFNAHDQRAYMLNTDGYTSLLGSQCTTKGTPLQFIYVKLLMQGTNEVHTIWCLGA